MSTVVEAVTVGNVRVTRDDEGTVRLQGFVVNDGSKALGFTELEKLLVKVFDAGVEVGRDNPNGGIPEENFSKGGYWEWIK